MLIYSASCGKADESAIRQRHIDSLVVIQLEPGTGVRAESGAMVSMAGQVAIQTKASGGILSSLKRSLLGRESFFLNEYQAVK